MITNCNTFGIEFVFSVSPGLDLVFHSQQDYDQLLKKFQQLKDLGCRSFAVLWDDINAELQGVDAKGIGYNKLQIAFQEDSKFNRQKFSKVLELLNAIFQIRFLKHYRLANILWCAPPSIVVFSLNQTFKIQNI